MDTKRRRLRSGTVILGSVGALAAMLTACSSDADKRCVDRDNYDWERGYKVVDSSECRRASGSGGVGSSSRKSRKAGSRDVSWYYGGDFSNGRVGDGSFNKSSVSRGGFGSKSGSSGG